ncbi:MAG: hypothetical protein JRF65_05435 [Deltaproteobacteria bacterium]|nr:hypothetical protein [Deltaproteobacteria bacterium]
MKDPIKALLLAFGLAGTWFWIQGDLLLNLADEGFLWYGTWQTSLGGVPMRDFHAYDPGRYYWVSGWSVLFGTGIMGMRAAVVLFQATGLFFGLLALRRVIRPWWGLAMAGALLVVWMYPSHKMFGHSLAMAAVYFGVLLLEKPSLLRHFAAGIFVGVAAFFGRNHGLYSFAAFLALILLIRVKWDRERLFQRLAVWGAGISVGYSPMLLMCVLVPGFFDSLVDSIVFFFRIKATNLPLPVPWPWTVDFSGANRTAAASSFSTGLLYLILPLFYAGFGLYFIFSRKEMTGRQRLLAACILVGALYLHRSFSRASVSFLAQGIHPFLMGAVSLPFLARKGLTKTLSWALLTLVAVLTWFSVVTVSPYYRMASAAEGSFAELKVSGSRLGVYRSTAELVRSVERIHARVGAEERLLIAPHWPGFYPLLKQASPLWETYFLFPETTDRQMRMIRRMDTEKVNWVILGDVPLDGWEDLRFQNTHGLLWQHIMANFEPVPAEGLPWNYQLLKRKKDYSPQSRRHEK